jgi:hypothetical protein
LAEEVLFDLAEECDRSFCQIHNEEEYFVVREFGGRFPSAFYMLILIQCCFFQTKRSKKNIVLITFLSINIYILSTTSTFREGVVLQFPISRSCDAAVRAEQA